MESIMTSILSGFAASALFLIFLSQLRPKIEISAVIGVRQSENGSRYVVKIINRGHRNAVNIKAELSRVRVRVVPDGQVHSTRKIELRKDSIFSLSKFNRKSAEASYAYRFSSSENIDSLWGDDSTHFFRLKLYAQDEMSGFGKVFIKEFRAKRNSLIDGEFKHGDSLEIA